MLSLTTLVVGLVSKLSDNRHLFSENYDSFQRAVVSKRQILYDRFKRGRRRGLPVADRFMPPSSYSIAYRDAAERLRLERQVSMINAEINSSLFISEHKADSLIAVEDQLDALMQRWNHGLPISQGFTSRRVSL